MSREAMTAVDSKHSMTVFSMHFKSMCMQQVSKKEGATDSVFLQMR